MICRRPTLFSAASAALTLLLAVAPSSARADSITTDGLTSSTTPARYYVFTPSSNIAAIGTSTTSGPEVIFQVPTGTIVPPVDPTTGDQTVPLIVHTPSFTASTGTTYTTASQYATTSGAQDVVVGLKDTTNASGQPVEYLGLSFRDGLSAGQSLVFALNVADPNNPPSLSGTSLGTYATSSINALGPLPTPSTPVVVSTPATTTTTTTSTTSTAPVVQTPEPLSLALWSALAGAGFLRARAFRRSQLIA